MNKKTVAKVCYAIGMILLLCFIVKTIIDGVQYSEIETSAPFYAYILINAFYFVFPAAIAFVVGFLINKNARK